MMVRAYAGMNTARSEIYFKSSLSQEHVKRCEENGESRITAHSLFEHLNELVEIGDFRWRAGWETGLIIEFCIRYGKSEVLTKHVGKIGS